MTDAPHIPVMLAEVLETLSPKDGEIYVDGTFGAGGYTRAILGKADCRVVAIDRDETAIANGQALVEEMDGRLMLLHGAFGDVAQLLTQAGFEQVDGFVIDIGVSSMQIDQAERGFSFRYDAPLDMRMDTSSGETAADIVNSREEEELANLIYAYGEERLSRRIAKAIVAERVNGRIERTGQLAEIVRASVPRSPKDKLDPATRTFQALRIAVNDELDELERALAASLSILKPGGRLVVVSFHSLEDRIVKTFLKDNSPAKSRTDKYASSQDAHSASPFTLITSKALIPTEAETKLNPRARSAKLRAAIRTTCKEAA
ncbi:MAG: 16S rRNA (cytosine(1402)-N(4))-methyltransferase RsmH [Pseudobdellovibrionaceae bacterium]